MVNKIVTSRMVLVGLLVSGIPYSTVEIRCESRFLAAIGVGALAGGIYSLGSWLFTPSDQKIIDNLRGACHGAQPYSAVVSALESLCGIDSESASFADKHQVVTSVSEPVLYQLATDYLRSSGLSIRRFISNLNEVIACIEKKDAALCKRMEKVAYKHGITGETYRYMVVERSHAMRILLQLKFVRDYCTEHASYFALYQIEGRLGSDYRSAIDALQQYQYDQYSLQSVLRSLIIRVGGSKHPGYYYKTYLQSVSDSINALGNALARLSHTYHNRIECAQQLKNALHALYTVVTSDPEYARVMQEYERYLMEQERLHLERERVRLEQERVHAEHERIREQARLERESARAEKERLRLEYEHREAEYERIRLERERVEALQVQNQVLHEQNLLKEWELQNAQTRPSAPEVVVVEVVDPSDDEIEVVGAGDSDECYSDYDWSHNYSYE